MKFFLAMFAVVAGLAMVQGAVTGGDCTVSEDACTSVFSGFPHIQHDMNRFTKQMLVKSFDFLLLSSTFDVYSTDRPGFEKLYRKISDKAWEDTMDLIKYQSKRGASVTLDGDANDSTHQVDTLLQSNETSSLKLTLDYEKLLANATHHMHKKISHADSSKHYDPDVAHYLDENFIEYQSGIWSGSGLRLVHRNQIKPPKGDSIIRPNIILTEGGARSVSDDEDVDGFKGFPDECQKDNGPISVGRKRKHPSSSLPENAEPPELRRSKRRRKPTKIEDV
ncbi:uncharacterized protein LOC129758786 [Uranotaenia lowii]|uniref:uncharacterized protein LOC129758786 n=1 Tax=Uranotaenia lowii TaxID=190385 RepID=UPI002478D477|nr:uncharacterized protein LOC129758786 [Uranotaenia lowii]